MWNLENQGEDPASAPDSDEGSSDVFMTATDIATEMDARTRAATEMCRALLGLPGNADLVDAMEIVLSDPDVSQTLVRAANLLAPNRRSSVDSARDAVRMIGLRHTQAVTLLRLLAPRGEARVARRDAEWFLSNALRLRDVAAWVSDRLVPEVAEHVRLVALLCDYGQVALAEVVPELYEDVLENSEQAGRPVGQSEVEFLGFTHAEVGAHFFRLWGVSDDFCEAIRCHHDPAPAKSSRARVIARVLKVATTLVEAKELAFDKVGELVRTIDDDGDADPETVATVTTELRTATRTDLTLRSSPIGDLIEALRSR